VLMAVIARKSIIGLLCRDWSTADRSAAISVGDCGCECRRSRRYEKGNNVGLGRRRRGCSHGSGITDGGGSDGRVSPGGGVGGKQIDDVAHAVQCLDVQNVCLVALYDQSDRTGKE
jgi:hypothetical protein